MTPSPIAAARDDAGWSAWPAPAKLNLFLHIVGRRNDGYHLLQTVFQLLDRGDTVRLQVRRDGAIRRIDPLQGIDVVDDLAVRAAHALRVASGISAGADIAIDKHIPLGGGLGGGSSDAATTLVALNALWSAGLSDDELAAIGLALGADVPVFVRGQSAWAEGVGECLTPVELPQRWFVVIDPGIGVTTADLFCAPDLTRNSPHLTIPLFASGVATANVFEPVVRARFRAVAQALDWLNGRSVARLSGSGGCIFASVASREIGLALLEECPVGMRGFVAAGAAESPLRVRLREWRNGSGFGWGVAKW